MAAVRQSEGLFLTFNTLILLEYQSLTTPQSLRDSSSYTEEPDFSYISSNPLSPDLQGGWIGFRGFSGGFYNSTVGRYKMIDKRVEINYNLNE